MVPNFNTVFFACWSREIQYAIAVINFIKVKKELSITVQAVEKQISNVSDNFKQTFLC